MLEPTTVCVTMSEIASQMTSLWHVGKSKILNKNWVCFCCSCCFFRTSSVTSYVTLYVETMAH